MHDYYCGLRDRVQSVPKSRPMLLWCQQPISRVPCWRLYLNRPSRRRHRYVTNLWSKQPPKIDVYWLSCPPTSMGILPGFFCSMTVQGVYTSTSLYVNYWNQCSKTKIVLAIHDSTSPFDFPFHLFANIIPPLNCKPDKINNTIAKMLGSFSLVIQRSWSMDRSGWGFRARRRCRRRCSSGDHWRSWCTRLPWPLSRHIWSK